MPKMNGNDIEISVDRRSSGESSQSSDDVDLMINGMDDTRRRSRSSSIPELIAIKRDGGCFSGDEIDHLVNCVVNKEMQDSQLDAPKVGYKSTAAMYTGRTTYLYLFAEELCHLILRRFADVVDGALLMAIFLKGMSLPETIRLTNCMRESGDNLEWPDEWKDLMVDKHSTGGVGDKVSLPLAPALAACGLKVPMISGRGLDFTGGTLDKLESIEGFSVSQSLSDMKNILEDVGCCIVGQTETLVPADRIMYAIRDVTSTTASIPLIAASIISKKAAENLSGLVLDVKFGKGAFLKSYTDAKDMAKTLVHVSNGIGINTTAILSNMNNPLGNTIGNALEVGEAIECLQGRGPKVLRELVTALGGQLLYSTDRVNSIEAGKNKIASTLEDGSALEKFTNMIIAQGTTPTFAKKLCSASNPLNYLPKAAFQTELHATKTGYVNNIDALACAQASSSLGAGRTKAGQSIDLAVGLQLHVKAGDKICTGEIWVTIHHNSDLSEDILFLLEDAFEIDENPPAENEYALIKEIITV